MRIITTVRVKQAMIQYPQWRIGLQLWKDTLSSNQVSFESFQQMKDLWKERSGWNLDRVPARKIRDNSFQGSNYDLYIFDIHGTHCRLLARLDSERNKLFIRDILSHSEYDKWLKANLK